MATFSGKNVLIVGGSSGIGFHLAQQLLEQGATVFTASRQQPDGLNAEHFTLNVQDMSGSELDALPDTLHGVVYAPGTINLKPFPRLKVADFEQDFQVNVLGAVKVLQAVLPRLKKAEASSVVLYSTVAVQTGMNFHASVAAAKGAIEGLARSLAAEFASANIRVNAIAPSLVDTPLADKLLGNDKKKEAAQQRHPIKRVGSTNDIASLSAFLLSEDAGWITGQVIGVDGGLSALKPL